MKDSLKKSLFFIATVLLLLVFNIIFFFSVSFEEANAMLWIGYAFIDVAFILVGGMTFSRMKRSTITPVFPFPFPFSLITLGYLTVSVILNVVFIFVNGESPVLPLVVNFVLLILGICCVLAFKSFSRIEDNVAAREKRVRQLRETSIKVSSLTYLTNDVQVKNAIRAFKEKIDNSSSAGTSATVSAEEQLEGQIDVIRQLITDGAESEAILQAIHSAEGILKMRNQLLMASR